MKKKKYTYFLTALAAILFSALPSQAQWDARFWPAREKPPRKIDGTNIVFQKEIATSNLIEAVRERTWAVTKSELTIIEDVISYSTRNPERSLEELKASTAGLLGSFLDQTRFPTPYDPASISVNTPTSSVLQLVYWNVTNMLTHCNLPTNFFEFTPVRNLAGHEGFVTATNDVLYGWDALRKVITNLVYTTEGGILINETKSIYQSGVTYAQPFDCPAPQNCEFIDNSISPISITSLSLANASGEVSFSEQWRQFSFIPNEGEDFNAWAEYAINGTAGFPFFYIGPAQSPLSSNGAHIAYSFELETGYVLAASNPSWNTNDSRYSAFLSCGFSTNFPVWRYVQTFSTKAQLADSAFVGYSASRVGADQSDCSICDFIANIFTDAGDILEKDCIGTREPYGIDYGWLLWDDDKLTSQKTRTHVIQWDFTYK